MLNNIDFHIIQKGNFLMVGTQKSHCSYNLIKLVLNYSTI